MPNTDRAQILPALQKANDRLVTWCRDDALPFWATQAIDPQGGLYESLELDGTPVANMLRRVRVQARLAYVYAHAFDLGWYTDNTASDRAWAQLTGPGFQSENDLGGCAHLLNPDGSLHDGLRDTYAQSFVLLAGSWRYKAFGDEDSLKTAAATALFLDQHLTSPHGGYLEGTPPPQTPRQTPRRQNPHMHLFESFLTLYQHTKEELWREKATAMCDLFLGHFFDSNRGVLREFFLPDWQLDPAQGDLVEPGHMMEWCWLLGEYGAACDINVTPICRRLYARALELGQQDLQPDAIQGYLCDVVSLSGRQPAMTYRSWPQTEYLKASITLARLGDQDAEQTAAALIEQLFATYLDVPLKGGYRDQYRTDGSATAGPMQASTFYHLLSAAAVVYEYCNDTNRIAQ